MFQGKQYKPHVIYTKVNAKGKHHTPYGTHRTHNIRQIKLRGIYGVKGWLGEMMMSDSLWGILGDSWRIWYACAASGHLCHIGNAHLYHEGRSTNTWS